MSSPYGVGVLRGPNDAETQARLLAGGGHLFAPQLDFLAEVIEEENPLAEQEREEVDDDLIDQLGLEPLLGDNVAGRSTTAPVPEDLPSRQSTGGTTRLW